MLQVELEIGIGRARAMVGEARMLFEESVDVDSLPVARASTHHEHVVNDPVGAVTVGAYTPEVIGEVVRYLLDK